MKSGLPWGLGEHLTKNLKSKRTTWDRKSPAVLASALSTAFHLRWWKIQKKPSVQLGVWVGEDWLSCQGPTQNLASRFCP